MIVKTMHTTTTSKAIYLCSLLGVLFSASAFTHAQDWTRFRGPNGQGVSVQENLPTDWGENKNVVWKTPISLAGWSSPIVVKDAVYLSGTMAEGRECYVMCLDAKNGQQRWLTPVHTQQTTRMRKQNSYATPTPVSDGKAVYAVFFDGTAVAVDLEGKLIWKNSDYDFYSLHGLGASPTLFGSQLIMPFDGSSKQEEKLGWKTPWQEAAVISYNTADGSINWTARRGDSRVGHVTPIVHKAEQQLISAGGDRVQGHSLATGELVWSVYSQGEGVTPSPVLGENMLFTSSGFEAPTIRAIRLGGKGDVTETHIAWEQTKGVPALASPLLVGDELYTITRDNILHCIAANSGEIHWMQRLEGVHSASPMLAGGKIYISSEDGLTLIIAPGKTFVELAKNKLSGTFKASFAVSGKDLILRSDLAVYCIGER